MTILPVFETVLNPEDANLEPIRRGLDEFNVAHVGRYTYARVAVFARDDSGAVVGGVYGDLLWDWLYVQSLWVQSDYRSQDVGSTLLALVEAEALKHGISKAHLETTSFQALEFYRKQGYEVFGKLEGKPAGTDWYYLKKEQLGEPVISISDG